MSKLPERKMICITGSIGSGKSSVSKILKQLGYPVLDLDEVVRKLYQNKAIIKEVNILLFNEDHDILDISRMSKCIFKNEEKKQQLEKYLYPKVFFEMLKFKEEYSVCFVEMALVFEKQWDKYFDEIVCVYTNFEIAKTRLIQQRHFTLNEILNRMKNQYSPEYKKQHSDYIITNDYDINHLKDNVVMYLKERGLYGK